MGNDDSGVSVKLFGARPGFPVTWRKSGECSENDSACLDKEADHNERPALPGGIKDLRAERIALCLETSVPISEVIEALLLGLLAQHHQ
jgi:hypothetical protein